MKRYHDICISIREVLPEKKLILLGISQVGEAGQGQIVLDTFLTFLTADFPQNQRILTKS